MQRTFVSFATLCALMLFQAAHAQSSTPQASDSWSKPASASTVHYGDGARSGSASQDSHFKFKDAGSRSSNDFRPDPNRPQAINDTSAPLDNNGRPAANCASDPRQSKCHP